MRIPPLVRSALPAVSSAALYALAFPPANLFLLVFVALVPWFSSLRSATPKAAWRSGLFFGWLFWMFHLWWLVPFVGRWTGSWFLGLVPWLLAPTLGIWYFGLLGWLVQRSYAARLGWLVPVVWAGVEVLRSYFPVLAFPWGLLATPLWLEPAFMQFAKVGTIFGVSALVALVNWAVAEAMPLGVGTNPCPSIGPRALIPMALGVALANLLPTLWLRERETGTMIPITVGQPGVDLAFGKPSESQTALADACSALIATASSNGSRFLVLPEGLTTGGSTLPPRAPFELPPAVPVVFGGTRSDGGLTHQSAFAYDGEWSFVDKTRLVIFGEFVPLRGFLPFLQAFNLPTGDLTPGDRVRSLGLAGVRVGPLLCFEALFPDLAWKQADDGARLLAVLSIDDWYMGSSAPDQLLAGSVWRAVESGLPLVRSASMGHSVAVDASGNIVGRIPLGERRAMRVEVRVPPVPETFAFRKAFPLLALLGTFAVVVAPWVTARRAGRAARRA